MADKELKNAVAAEPPLGTEESNNKTVDDSATATLFEVRTNN